MMNKTVKYIIRWWDVNDKEHNSQNNLFVFFFYTLKWGIIFYICCVMGQNGPVYSFLWEKDKSQFNFN